MNLKVQGSSEMEITTSVKTHQPSRYTEIRKKNSIHMTSYTTACEQQIGDYICMQDQLEKLFRI